MKLSPIITALLLANAGHSVASSYDIQEIPLSETGNFHFGMSIDNTGKTLSSLRSRFNPAIDLSLLDLEQFVLEDAEAAAQGNFTTSDYQTITNRLIANTNEGGLLFQKLASELAYSSDGTDISYVKGFDEPTEATNGFTFSMNMRARDSVNGTHIVGNMAGPFAQIPFTTNNDIDLIYTVNEFAQRAFVQVGEQVTPLVPAYTDGGGFSHAVAINQNLQVAGVSSIAAPEGTQEVIDGCRDDDVRGDEPVEACIYRIAFQNSFAQQFLPQVNFLYRNILFESSPTSFLEIRPTLWQVDANGQVISSQTYPRLHEPEAFDSRMYTRVTGLNNAGTMVGFTTVPESEREELIAVATVFENGQTSRLFEEEGISASYAMDINDDNIVVGFFPAIFNDQIRNRMFVYDRTNQALTQPQGFFVSSSTYPRAVNNNNLVVGEAEVEILDPSTRRYAGFLYNVESGEFQDLNDLLPCDSPYSIVSAIDINDNNEIIADAQISRPARNIRGEVITGDDASITDYVVSVKLTPTGNPASDCDGNDDFVERQGASNSLGWLGMLLLIGLFRRRK